MGKALPIRTITGDELVAYREALMTTFGEDLDSDTDGAARTGRLIPLAQLWAAFDGDTIVATAGSFDLELGVPGGAIPMAGLTMVSVRPTHRRRGLLTELMRVHLDDARRRGHAVSGLWASEAQIYGRFGYGLAAESDELEIADARGVELTGPLARELDALEWADEARARRALPPIYARALAGRPGVLVRSEAWWRERRFLEPEIMRAGASRRRHVLAVRGGEPVGYVQYRQRPKVEDGLHAGRVEIIELVGVDARAEATLWQFALRVDLAPTVAWWNAPTDDVLPWLASDGRRIRRRRTDTLWLRIEDVPAALAARRYAPSGGGRLGLAVDGAAWELVVADGGGRCEPIAPADAELRIARAALGSLYLGGVPASRLARIGLVEGSAAAIAEADRLLGWPVAPWCPEVF